VPPVPRARVRRRGSDRVAAGRGREHDLRRLRAARMGPALAGRADLEGAVERMSEPAPPLESALLLPVPEAEPCVQRHRLRHVSAALGWAPAPITVLSPSVAPAQISAPPTRAVGAVPAQFPEFPFGLPSLERFPEGATYLAPDPADPFVRL